ncbi:MULTISPECIES: alpha/beta hydrolase [Mycobacterium]|uniref:alpha/beta hydrolase n=1 Tax=Mycobacterium TaxID=1763 RepID=UPI000961C4CC|nr:MULTISPECIES: alpha/beta hydrolase [Mycobacterium]MCG7608699.1 alpha/beta hydrolase [Mycobacterium sp. CnD-18-1]OLT97587.1 esterase [Mycobacterium syngnathidarum]
MTRYALESAAREFAEAAARSLVVYQMTVPRARTVLESLQAAPIHKPAVESSWVVVVVDGVGCRTRIVRPSGWNRPLPVVLYLHGGGWVLGSAGTHDRLVREIAVGVPAAVVFVDYERAPEARYPHALEQAYAVARWIRRDGADWALDANRMAVAGDSAGGNLAAALMLLTRGRGDVEFVHQSLYYPVTDAARDTDSYREFADGPHLTARAMAWFWDAYVPDVALRGEVTVSPLRATTEQLADLPPAFVIVSEYDVLRDEGEAYARKLTDAGLCCTSVRYGGTFHDFMMLNALRTTSAATEAIGQAIRVLQRAFHS